MDMAMQFVSHFAKKRALSKACDTPGLQAHGIKCGQNFPGAKPRVATGSESVRATEPLLDTSVTQSGPRPSCPAQSRRVRRKVVLTYTSNDTSAVSATAASAEIGHTAARQAPGIK